MTKHNHVGGKNVCRYVDLKNKCDLDSQAPCYWLLQIIVLNAWNLWLPVVLVLHPLMVHFFSDRSTLHLTCAASIKQSDTCSDMRPLHKLFCFNHLNSVEWKLPFLPLIYPKWDLSRPRRHPQSNEPNGILGCIICVLCAFEVDKGFLLILISGLRFPIDTSYVSER